MRVARGVDGVGGKGGRRGEINNDDLKFDHNPKFTLGVENIDMRTGIQTMQIMGCFVIGLLRSPFAVVGFTVAGVIVSFVVATGFSLFDTTEMIGKPRNKFSHLQGDQWYIQEDTFIGTTVVFGGKRLVIGHPIQNIWPPDKQFEYNWNVYYGELKKRPTRDGKMQVDTLISCGWPFRSFATGFNLSARFDAMAYGTMTQGFEFGIEVPLGTTKGGIGPGIIPLRPLTMGLILDTIFYAFILCGVIVSFRGLVVYSRLKRQRCPSCGYQLRELVAMGCPECGWGRGADGGT